MTESGITVSMEWFAVTATLAVVAIALLFAWLSAWARSRSKHRALRMRFEQGRRGEAAAEGLLEQQGYRVVGSQVATRYAIGVDSSEVLVDLRADYLVERRGECFVAEVKTGRQAPSLATSATRRQLLEYRLAFGVSGVLLVDVDAGVIRAVSFPWLDRQEEDDESPFDSRRMVVVVLALAVGLVAGVIAARVVLR